MRGRELSRKKMRIIAVAFHKKSPGFRPPGWAGGDWRWRYGQKPGFPSRVELHLKKALDVFTS